MGIPHVVVRYPLFENRYRHWILIFTYFYHTLTGW